MDSFLTSRIMSDILNGVTNGALYGLVALSLVLIWRSTSILNFAQGAMPMLATYVGMAIFAPRWGYWVGSLLSIVAGFLIGAVTERGLVRFLYGKPELNPVVVMVGFLIVLESVVAAIWSTSPRGFAAPFSSILWQLGGNPFALSPFSLFKIAVSFGVMLITAALFRFTNLGLQLRASAVAPEVSRLLGVRVNRMLTLGWVLSMGVATITAVLVSSNFLSGLTPQVMDGVFIYGFIAAAAGGLESPSGAVVAGIGLGVVLQFVQDYANPNAPMVAALVLLVVVLLVRPSGLFARQTSRRV